VGRLSEYLRFVVTLTAVQGYDSGAVVEWPVTLTVVPAAQSPSENLAVAGVVGLIGMFVVIELISNNLMEPWLYATSTGISTVAVLVSAVFWTWLWGPIGLVLATPLTICLVVLGRHVESLKFLDVMFGNRPALSPPKNALRSSSRQCALASSAVLRTITLSSTRSIQRDGIE